MATEQDFLKHLLSEKGSEGDIVTNDSTPNIWEGVYVGVGGSVKLTDKGGTTKTFINVPTGFILPVKTKVIFALGTDATNLIGL